MSDVFFFFILSNILSCSVCLLLNRSLDNIRNMKTLINYWLAHQSKSICSVQENLAPRSNEKHLMSDTQDEGGRSRAQPFLALKGKLSLFGTDYYED